jgi:hypothetical protein
MRASSVRAIAHAIVTDGDELDFCLDTSLEQGVREPSAPTPGHDECRYPTKPSAHPSNRLVTQLNENWKVVDDPLQWILQRRKGNPRKKNSGWRDRSFCTTREGLLRCVSKYCGEVDQVALARLTALSPNHPMQNLDVHGTGQAQAETQLQGLALQGIQDCAGDEHAPRSSQSALC